MPQKRAGGKKKLRFKDSVTHTFHRIGGWQYFSPRHHAKHLQLNNEFIESLSEKTRLLEIGGGSGRLVDWLLRKAKRLKPENIEAIDLIDSRLGYRATRPHFKRRVFDLVRIGRIAFKGGNAFEEKYSSEAYDHILVPEAFFASSHPRYAELCRRHGGLAAGALVLQELLAKLLPAVKRNGTIRISNVLEDIREKFASLPAFEGAKISYTQRGMIVEKK